MRIKFICLAIASLLLSDTLTAREFYFKHYTVENGLSNNTVTCVMQDRRGFIWFGTKDGLNKFDGYTFKTYKKNQPNINGLTSNSITAIASDDDGNIWVGTEKGLFKFNEVTEKFELIQHSASKHIRKFVITNNSIWLIADFEICRYIPGKNEFKNYSQLYSFYGISTVLIDKKSDIWVGTLDGQIAHYNNKIYTFEKYNLFKDEHVNSLEITNILDDGANNLWVTTAASGLKKFNTTSKQFENIITKTNSGTDLFARHVLQINDDEFWVGTENGIYIYYSNKKEIIHLKKDYSNSYSLSDNAVYFLFKDKEGGIWAATYFGGLNYYTEGSINIIKKFPGQNSSTISGNAIREIVQDKYGNLWIGSEDAGLNKYLPSTGQYQHFKPGDGSGLTHTNIHGLAIDDDKLWIGTFENGLDVLDINSNRVIKHYSTGSEKNSLKSNFIHSILKTSKQQLYFATSNGFYKYNSEEDNFHLFDEFPINTFYSSIAEGRDGTIWTGTFSSGIYYINEAKGINGKLQIIKAGKNLLNQTRVIYLKFDSDNNFWIATEDGLYKLSADLKTVTEYNTSKGFPSNMIYTVNQDTSGNYWVTTSKGLVRIDYKTKQLRIFSKSDGLLNDQFNYSSSFVDQKNNMYFGSVKGLIFFNASNYKTINYQPPVYITNFLITSRTNGHEPNNNPINPQTNSITLKHYQASFNIEFAALNFAAPENIEYAYKLSGQNGEWNYIKKNRSVYFTNVSPGQYKFQVRSTNRDGVWMNNEASLNITILPPWWLSITAKILYTLLAIGILFLILRWSNSRQRAKHKRKMELFEINKQKELYQNQLELFTNVAHEIKTPLTLIKGPMDKIMKSIDELPKAEKNLRVMSRNTDRLYELTKQLLDFRKLESSQLSISLQQIDMLEFTHSILIDFEEMIESSKTEVIIIANEKNYTIEADEDSMKKIITNLIANALKYGHSLLRISFTKNNDTVCIKFGNDGTLIPDKAAKEIFKPFFRVNKDDNAGGTGIGLSLARSLTELHNGKLTFMIEDHLNTFELTIPIKQQD